MGETLKSKKNVNDRIQEAEAYYMHELYQEACDLYEQILADYVDLDRGTQDSIMAKIQHISKIIDDREQFDKQTLTTQDISMIKAADIEESVPEIFDGAKAYKELGLYEEAIAEFSKLFKKDYPAKKIIPHIAECYFELYEPQEAVQHSETLISENKLENKEIAEIKFKIALTVEKKGLGDLAFEIYQTVQKIDPDYPDLQAKIDAVMSKRSYNSRYAYLLEASKVNAGQLKQALELSRKSNKSVEWVLIEQNMAKKEDIAKSLAYFYKLPFTVFDEKMDIPYELVAKLKKAFLLQNGWAPLSWNLETGAVQIVIDDPKDLTKTDSIAAVIKSKKIAYTVGIREDIESIIKHYFDSPKEGASEEEEENDMGMLADIEFEEEEELEDVGEEYDEEAGQVVKMVDQMLISAYRKGTSDIHVEPSVKQKKVIVRYRIDGVCQEVTRFPLSLGKGVLSRLKIMAGLDIAERRLPQDGKIKFKRKGVKGFELRLATLPTAGGYEDAVLRILAESGAMALDDMGIKDRNLGILKQIIQQPYGLILVVGPTGSGKTTTLHSALAYINKPGIKIWTAEDPVEISQEGLRQVQCHPKIGLDFARVMRAFLRADPDVIMIGEMRDHETAAIGIEASLTGHLVFSTLHTNSAPETITRLLDMGLNPLNFSDAFLGVMAQRLIRRVCKKCRQEYFPTKEEFSDIVQLYGQEAFEKTGIEFLPDLVLYRAQGCEECNGTGYKGRMGIHEMLEGTKELKLLVKNQASTEQMFKQGFADGMTTLIQDGILKVFDGLSDISEVRRVVVS